MLLLDPTRRLTEIAADAVRDPPHPGGGRGEGSWRQVFATPCVPSQSVGAVRGPGRVLDRDHHRWSDLAALVGTSVLGGPGPLDTVFTEDARGWSPTFAFNSRHEAELALADPVAPLTPVLFDVECLFWAEPILFAEWHLDATVTDPLLVADDVLIEAQGRPLALGGASVARLRGARIARIHTYFDEAALIEQVILDRG